MGPGGGSFASEARDDFREVHSELIDADSTAGVAVERTPCGPAITIPPTASRFGPDRAILVLMERDPVAGPDRAESPRWRNLAIGLVASLVMLACLASIGVAAVSATRIANANAWKNFLGYLPAAWNSNVIGRPSPQEIFQPPCTEDSMPWGLVEYSFKKKDTSPAAFAAETRAQVKALFALQESEPSGQYLLNGSTSFQGKKVSVSMYQTKSGKSYQLYFEYDPGLCELMGQPPV